MAEIGPDPSSVVVVIPFSAGATLAAEAGGTPPAVSKYTVIRTNEVDEYEDGLSNEAVLTAAAKPVGDKYTGSSRKASKTAIADAPVEKFADVAKLIGTLEADANMAKHNPPITTAPTSRRTAEEKRNVRVDGFLYAASREDDNDFHLILGLDPDADDPVFMNIELSGLPNSNNASFKKLKKARDAYKKFFAAHPAGIPGTSYDFYKPPVPVRIEGSLFFDINHVKGGRPGPKSLRPNIPTLWEIHPISKITFEP